MNADDVPRQTLWKPVDVMRGQARGLVRPSPDNFFQPRGRAALIV
jgi:hypothetical protein